ncbi:MAG: hypothetical protein AB7G21_05870 [Dehalococcoidia bacterium]
MNVIRLGVVIGLLFALGSSGVVTARTANLSMTTPPKVGTYSSTIDATALAPAACGNAASLTAVAVAPETGNFAAGAGNQLVLGRPHTSNYTLNGSGGVDCVVGGQGSAGRETLRGGGGGNDYCIGNGSTGSGTQVFNADCDGNTTP